MERLRECLLPSETGPDFPYRKLIAIRGLWRYCAGRVTYLAPFSQQFGPRRLVVQRQEYEVLATAFAVEGLLRGSGEQRLHHVHTADCR